MIIDLGKLKVLVVEDNREAAHLIRMVLRDMGVNQIFDATDGREALDFLDKSEQFINLVISDWNMPRMTGIELLRQIRSVRPDMPFLMITARGSVDAVKEARDQGVSAYVVKPFAPAELERKLISLYRRAQAAAPAESE